MRNRLLFNFFLGIVVKTFPESYSAVFSALYGAMALGTLLGMAWLMRWFQIPDGIAGAVCLLFALSPGFPVYRNWLFYTLPVAFLLVSSAVALTVYLEKTSRAALVAFSALVLAIMMCSTRCGSPSPACALVPFVHERLERKRFLIACAIPFLMTNLLFLKNYALVGSYSGSTWLGLSLTKRWPLSQREVTELKSSGKLPELWQRRPFQEPDHYQRFGFFEDRTSGHPALDAPYKSNGEPNFNHRDYVAISDTLLEAGHDPDRELSRALPSPRGDVDHALSPARSQLGALSRRLRLRKKCIATVTRGRSTRFSAAMSSDPSGCWRRLRTCGSCCFRYCSSSERVVGRAGPFVFMLVCIVWVGAVTNLIEIGENDRMRWEVEPFLTILFAFAVSRVLLFLRRLKRT